MNVVKRLADRVLRVRNLVVGHGLCLVLDLVGLVRPIRLLFMMDNRIGHFLAETGYYLRRRALKMEPAHGDVIVVTPRANQTIGRILSRRVPLVCSAGLRRAVDWARAVRPKHKALYALPHVVYDAEVWPATGTLMSLSPEDMAAGRQLLARMGVPEGAEYICFAARDGAYLSKTGGDRDFSYHNHRDPDLGSYEAMAEHFADAGYWAIRLGAVVEQPLKSTHPRLIDYPSRFRSEFGDVFLSATAKLFVGDSSGICHLPIAFGVPGVRANLGLGDIFAPWPDYLCIMCLYRDTASGEIVPYREALARGAHRAGTAADIRDMGLQMVYNTSVELIEAVSELQARRQGTWVDEPEDTRLRAAFLNCCATSGHVPRWPVDVLQPVSTRFLRRHANLFV